MNKKILFILIIITMFVTFNVISASDNNTIIPNNQNNITESNYTIHNTLNTKTVKNSADNQTYYINNSRTSNGNGSKLNPWNNLTQTVIDNMSDGSTVYLTSGIYKINNLHLRNSLNIIGENTSTTIIDCSSVNNNNNEVISITNTINIMNLSFKNSKTNIISNYGNLTVNNSYFYNNTCSSDTSACIENNGNLTIMNTEFYNVSSSKGSAISDLNSRTSKINIINSTFNQCLSLSGLGGACYFTKSNLIIQNSSFNNCSASYGGSIYSYDSNVSINSSIFKNNYALMGGAILVLNGSGDGTNFIEERSTININNSSFMNNNALYEGGALFDIYSNLTVINSNFTNNYGRNGGAIYSDYVVLSINESQFKDNNASSTGGAIYANINNISMKNNVFSRNLATYAQDLYSIYNITYDFSSNTWSSKSNSVIVDVITIEDSPTITINNINSINNLPSRYDLRDYGYVTSVKNQGSEGNCWAFATIATLESCILKATNNNYDLSEMNLKNIMALFSQSGWCISPNRGGYDNMPIAYLVGWLGPVLEIEDNNTESLISPVLRSLVHVNNVYGIPSRKNYTDNDIVKEAIMKYGAVFTDIIMSTSGNTSYYTGDGQTSHAVSIVGWDDNYSKSNFRTTPPGDGAFIVKNSWGNYSGDNGYYYVSYYDTSILNTCDDIIGVGGFTFILNDTEVYDKLYQYDFAGITTWYGNTTNISYSNEFTMSGNDIVSAFGTYVYDINNPYTLKVYINNKLNYTQNGYFTHLGYETVKINQNIHTKIGDNVKIELNITSKNKNIQVPISTNDYARLMIPTEKSYINNEQYSDAICCLKLYTKTTSTPTTINITLNNQTTTNTQLTIIIKANNTQLNNGIITITENQKIINIINMTSSQTIITYTNMTKGIHNITITYNTNNTNYKTSTKTIILNITENTTNLPENTIITLNKINNTQPNTTINITGKLISQTNKTIPNAKIIITINNQNTINTTTNTQGIFTSNIKTPNTIGTCNITATYNGNITYKKSTYETKFNIEKIGTTINLTNTTKHVGENVTIIASILDTNKKAVNGTVTLALDGKTLSTANTFDSKLTPRTFTVRNGVVNISVNALKFNKTGNKITITYTPLSNDNIHASSQINTTYNRTLYKTIYANSKGTGDGLTIETPTNLTNALIYIDNGGTINLIGTTNNKDTYNLNNQVIISKNTLTNTVTKFTIKGYQNHIITISGQNKTGILAIAKEYTVSIINTTFTRANTRNGGAIFNNGTLTLNNDTFTNNNAYQGSCIYNKGTVTITKTTLKNNNASYGGAILNEGNITMTSNTVINNSAVNSGGVINSKGTVILKSNKFTNNTAAFGGVIYSSGKANITNTNYFIANHVTKNGGTIYNFGVMNLQNNNFTANTANQWSGAVHNARNITVTSNKFALNTAGQLGGAMFNNANGTITSNTFESNRGKYGGAIYNGGVVLIQKNTIRYNNASQTGGAVANKGIVTLKSNKMTGNKAVYGGAIFSNNTVAVDSDIITYCVASKSGGAIYNIGNFTVKNSNFTGNKANMGGTIFNAKNMNLTNNNIISGNASLGGGLYNDGTTCNVVGNTFTKNHANYGGAAFTKKAITESKNTYTNNTAIKGPNVYPN
ncbi:C1 family peptidase [Methanosphaera sp. WGK6]|uniref:C1 family peptidase n=1 Tax=Methanosphaera sp. WGK6 TaxID=1561964 RepID=UPI00084C662C|nr:C1 family peptidase [Methanosphaera sp. WGK6]